MTTLDLLHRLIDELYAEGYADGRAAALGEVHREGDDGPGGGVTWAQIVSHAEVHQDRLSPWEKEMIDSASCSLHYGVPLTPRQCAKLRWIFFNRLGGKI